MFNSIFVWLIYWQSQLGMAVELNSQKCQVVQTQSLLTNGYTFNHNLMCPAVWVRLVKRVMIGIIFFSLNYTAFIELHELWPNDYLFVEFGDFGHYFLTDFVIKYNDQNVLFSSAVVCQTHWMVVHFLDYGHCEVSCARWSVSLDESGDIYSFSLITLSIYMIIRSFSFITLILLIDMKWLH